METYSDDDDRLASFAFSREGNSPDPIQGYNGKIPEVFAIFPDLVGTLTALQTAEDLAHNLEVLVVFTDVAGTLAALQWQKAWRKNWEHTYGCSSPTKCLTPCP